MFLFFLGGGVISGYESMKKKSNSGKITLKRISLPNKVSEKKTSLTRSENAKRTKREMLCCSVVNIEPVLLSVIQNVK